MDSRWCSWVIQPRWSGFLRDVIQIRAVIPVNLGFVVEFLAPLLPCKQHLSPHPPNFPPCLWVQTWGNGSRRTDRRETWQFLTLPSQAFPPSLLHHTLLPSAPLPPGLVAWSCTSKGQRREWRKWWRRERQMWRRNPERCPSGWMMMIYPPWCETEPPACIFKIPLSYNNRLHVLHSWSEHGNKTHNPLYFVGLNHSCSRF